MRPKLKTRSRLRDILHEHRVKQCEIATAMGKDVQQINAHVHGRKVPSLTMALTYCAALQSLTGKGFEVGDIWELL